MSEEESGPINDNFMEDLFTNTEYKLQHIEMPSGRSIDFNALISSNTDPDLTGQIIWPGCKLFLTYIDGNLDWFKGKSCIELGSGIAICTLFLTKFGAPKLAIATDGNKLVVDLMKSNAELSGCKNIKCKYLHWGVEAADAFKAQNGIFDIVMGSEIVYDEACVDPLVVTINSLLSQDGRFIVGHIFRYNRVTRYFMKRMDETGFELEKEIKWDDIMNYRMEMIEGSVLIFRRKKTL
ncbi:hypothetical protein TVAG_193910 [Trichomonas vaginalis G3]|uniref:Uncharacterized protein n=1 Tax=Trichomonas vaginalis (strain ATCC PRA-98 / G3) TaxID=412133 RepID=A2G627_TRIV3|nr:methyltransferase protein [Trichomonas vaginalis G3]EAX87396.1 hypothetical protein TVAG_193910 [Trichomonas vaginalis G3]KAI5493700.1 methyltransferase protein [Trichomonas vaginalis G3]|eukprot:XP_001300326.1 hypothetical protein [Trichomonas vaginalis G3]